jgi:hypothetical protein
MGAMKKVEDGESLTHMDGVWMATGITYDMMRNMGYPMDSVHLVLHADSTFAVDHLPDCIEDEFGRTLHKQLLVGEGRWKVYEFGGVWKLVLDFTRPGLSGHELFLDMDIFRDGPKLIVSQYIGDPDEVKVLEFYKEKIHG